MSRESECKNSFEQFEIVRARLLSLFLVVVSWSIFEAVVFVRVFFPSFLLFLLSGVFNGSLRRSILHDDYDNYVDDDDDKNDGGRSAVWLFKHFHHKFAREATRVSLALCNAFPLARPACSPPFHIAAFYC